MVRIGFRLPQFGGMAHEADRVAWFAAEAERLGAYSLWVGDRMIVPVEPGGRLHRYRLRPGQVPVAA